MKPYLPTALVCITILAGCSSIDFGVSSVIAQAPFKLRHKQISENSYYIESMGNGFASYEMLTKFFNARATELCVNSVAITTSKRGRAYPDAQLPEVRPEECYTGRCHIERARAPLVYGEARCDKPRS